MSHVSVALANPPQISLKWQRIGLGMLILLSIFAMFFAGPVMAQDAPVPTPGGTGSAATTTGRIYDVLNGLYGIFYGIGLVIITMAFLYVGYGMAYNGKRWSDVTNVFFGAMIAGMAAMAAGWFFS